MSPDQLRDEAELHLRESSEAPDPHVAQSLALRAIGAALLRIGDYLEPREHDARGELHERGSNRETRLSPLRRTKTGPLGSF